MRMAILGSNDGDTEALTGRTEQITKEIEALLDVLRTEYIQIKPQKAFAAAAAMKLRLRCSYLRADGW